MSLEDTEGGQWALDRIKELEVKNEKMSEQVGSLREDVKRKQAETDQNNEIIIWLLDGGLNQKLESVNACKEKNEGERAKLRRIFKDYFGIEAQSTPIEPAPADGGA